MELHLRPLVVAVAALAGGCAGGFTADPTQVDMEGAPSLILAYDAGYVWDRTKETLAHLSTRVPRFDDATGRAFATVDEGAIVAEVAELDPGTTRLAVKARRFGRLDDALALEVLDHIVDEVER